MQVKDIMTTKLVTVEMDDRLKVVKQIFDNTRFHHLLVVGSEELFGVISDRDVLEALSPNLGTAAETARDVATLNKRAHQIMTRKPTTLTPDADVSAVIEIFRKADISCIPVVDERNHPVGIVSWRDLLKVL